MDGGVVLEVAEIPRWARDSRATHRVWVTGLKDAREEVAFEIVRPLFGSLPTVGSYVKWADDNAVFFSVMFNAPLVLTKVGNHYDPCEVKNRVPD